MAREDCKDIRMMDGQWKEYHIRITNGLTEKSGMDDELGRTDGWTVKEIRMMDGRWKEYRIHITNGLTGKSGMDDGRSRRMA